MTRALRFLALAAALATSACTSTYRVPETPEQTAWLTTAKEANRDVCYPKDAAIKGAAASAAGADEQRKIDARQKIRNPSAQFLRDWDEGKTTYQQPSTERLQAEWQLKRWKEAGGPEACLEEEMRKRGFPPRYPR